MDGSGPQRWNGGTDGFERGAGRGENEALPLRARPLVRAAIRGEDILRPYHGCAAGMKGVDLGPKLLPPGQPLDLFVTVTDFVGYPEKLQLHSPSNAFEMEHRLTISFSTRGTTHDNIADPAELVFAGRSTASFPGAFPPFTVKELDSLLSDRKLEWPNRLNFLKRI